MDLPPDTPLTLPHALGNHASASAVGCRRVEASGAKAALEMRSKISIASYRNIHAPNNVYDARFDCSASAFFDSAIEDSAVQNRTEEQSSQHLVAPYGI
jgi:hypothetical protein